MQDKKLPKYYTTLNKIRSYSQMSNLEFKYLLGRLNKSEPDDEIISIEDILNLTGLEIALQAADGNHITGQEHLEFLLFAVDTLEKFLKHNTVIDGGQKRSYLKITRHLRQVCQGTATIQELEPIIYPIPKSSWDWDIMLLVKFVCFEDLNFALESMGVLSRKYPKDVRPWMFNRYKDLLNGYYADKVNTEGVYERIYKTLKE
jgi:hypothetical protein